MLSSLLRSSTVSIICVLVLGQGLDDFTTVNIRTVLFSQAASSCGIRTWRPRCYANSSHLFQRVLPPPSPHEMPQPPWQTLVGVTTQGWWLIVVASITLVRHSLVGENLHSPSWDRRDWILISIIGRQEYAFSLVHTHTQPPTRLLSRLDDDHFFCCRSGSFLEGLERRTDERYRERRRVLPGGVPRL